MASEKSVTNVPILELPTKFVYKSCREKSTFSEMWQSDGGSGDLTMMSSKIAAQLDLTIRTC
jgi:hypothetical protein